MSQQRFKSQSHGVFTEEMNKISLTSNDEKKDMFLMEFHHIYIAQVLE